MDDFLRWLAGLRGQNLEAGETLRFEFSKLPTGGVGLAALLAVVAVVVAIVLVYRRDAKRLSFFRRSTLAFLRIAALVLVALILLEPSLVKVRKTVRPGEVLLLLDTSQSMTHSDSYRRSEDRAKSWRAIGVEDPPSAERIALARKLLGQDGFVEGLASRNRLRAYTFGGSARPMPEKESKTASEKQAKGGQPGEAASSAKAGDEGQSATGRLLPPPPVFDLDAIRAEEGSTNLSASVRQALEQSRDARIAAVIVLTDGRKNAGSSSLELGAYLQRRKVGQTLVVPIGDPAETWTTALRDLLAAERVFKGDPLRVSAIFTSQGYEFQTLGAVLEEVGADGSLVKELSTLQVELGGETAAAQVEFPPVTLEAEGEHYLRVRLVPPSGEKVEERHARTQRVEVLGEKLRVLMISGAPTPEYRILRNQLIRDNTIDVSCWLQSADRDFPQDGNTPIKELPIEAKELDVFDVVIALDPDPDLLEPAFVSLTARAVEQRGLGLWWVMGEKFSLRCVLPGSPVTPLVKLLPIEADLTLAEKRIGIGLVHPKAYPWRLTTSGKEHRVTKIMPDAGLNAKLWDKLPGFYWSFPVSRAKPAAQVLVRHVDDRFRAEDGGRPMIALQLVGAGRVLYTGTDEFYRWRGVAEKVYDEVWVKGLRWLYEGKLAGGSSRYRLGLSAERVTLGSELEIYLRALDQSFEPVAAPKARVRVSGPDGFRKDIDIPRAAVGDGQFQGVFRPQSVGAWTVQAISDDGAGDEAVGRATRFEVRRAELESKGPMQIAELDRLAEAAGTGEVLTPAELVARAPQIRSFSTEETFTLPFPLWDGWFTLALILALLTIEWILRKRWNLV